MNKSDLAAAIAKQFDLAKNKAGQIVDAVFENITKALKKGETVPFIGFGTFSVKNRAARKGRNPATSELIKIPEKKVPYFKAGARLKEAVGGKKKK